MLKIWWGDQDFYSLPPRIAYYEPLFDGVEDDESPDDAEVLDDCLCASIL